MARVSVSIVIEAPVGRVWAAIADLSSHVEWMTDAERIDFETDTRSGVGTRMAVCTRIGPLRITDLIEVTEWVAGRSIGVSHQGLVRGPGRFDLAPVAGGTRFRWSETLSFPLPMGGPVTAWLAVPVLTSIWRRNLEVLKRKVEEA